MRKQTKIAALVSATALLALGASITSFAAARGTWMLVDGEWYCYDSNGELRYEDTFCVSNGKDYYRRRRRNAGSFSAGLRMMTEIITS